MDYLTKGTLLEAIGFERRRLEEKLAELTPGEMVWPGSMDDWSVKDILAHIVDWEQRLISWYQAGQRGEVPETPAPGMTWEDLPALNQAGYEKHKDEPLEQVLDRFQRSYRQTTGLVEGMSEEEIYSTGRYEWTGRSSLYSFIAECTFKHYNWARTQIRTNKIKAAQTNQSD